MKQSLGLFLILAGGVMFHIAAASTAPTNFREVWQDLLLTLGGKLDTGQGEMGGFSTPFPNGNIPSTNAPSGVVGNISDKPVGSNSEQ